MAYIRIPLRIHQLLFALEDRRALSSFAGFFKLLKTQCQKGQKKPHGLIAGLTGILKRCVNIIVYPMNLNWSAEDQVPWTKLILTRLSSIMEF